MLDNGKMQIPDEEFKKIAEACSRGAIVGI